MSGVFEVLAADQSDVQANKRKAVISASHRARNGVGTFLARSKTADEYDQRLELVRNDLTDVIQNAADELGLGPIDVEYVADSVYQSMESSFRPKESVRRPRMCPYHKQLTDIALNSGDVAGAYNAMSSHAWSDKHCESDGYGGDSCKFKPEMTTQSYWDTKADKARERREQQEALQAERAEQEFIGDPTEVEPVAEEEGGDIVAPEEPVAEESFDTDGAQVEEPEAVLASLNISDDEKARILASFQRTLKQAAPAGPYSGPSNYLKPTYDNPAAGNGPSSLGPQAPGPATQPQLTQHMPPASQPPLTQSMPPSSQSPLTQGIQNAPSAQDIHHQFATMAGDPSNGVHEGYNPEAHTQENYNQVAQHMGITPQQVQQGLQQYYNRPGTEKIPFGSTAFDNRGEEMAQPTSSVRWRASAGPTIDTGDSAQERVDIGKGNDRETDIPFKKEHGTSDNPTNTEGKGSPNPTHELDIDLRDRPTNKGELEQIGENVTKRVDIREGEEELSGPHTKTWTKNPGSAVTSAAEYDLPPEGDDNRPRKLCPQCGGTGEITTGAICTRCDGAGYLYKHPNITADVDKNPLREILESNVIKADQAITKYQSDE